MFCVRVRIRMRISMRTIVEDVLQFVAREASLLVTWGHLRARETMWSPCASHTRLQIVTIFISLAIWTVHPVRVLQVLMIFCFKRLVCFP